MNQEIVDLILEGEDETSEAIRGARESLRRLRETLGSIGRVAAAAFGEMAGDEDDDPIASLVPSGLRRFIRETKPGSYQRLCRLVGSDEGTQLVRLGRDTTIKALMLTGLYTQNEVADVFRLTRQRIQQICPGRLWKPSPPPLKKLGRMAQTLVDMGVPVSLHRDWLEEQLVSKGQTQAELGRRIGVKQNTLSQYCRKLGLDLSHRRGKGFNRQHFPWLVEPRPILPL